MTDTIADIETKEQVEVQLPKDYNVILHNDDKTTFDFVIYILVTIFEKNLNDAIKLTTYVHENGAAVAGTYSFQIAETKVEETVALADANNFPLNVTLEEAD